MKPAILAVSEQEGMLLGHWDHEILSSKDLAGKLQEYIEVTHLDGLIMKGQEGCLCLPTRLGKSRAIMNYPGKEQTRGNAFLRVKDDSVVTDHRPISVGSFCKGKWRLASWEK